MHRDVGTLRFFRRHPWLLRHGAPTQRRVARRAVRFARRELVWVRRELAETQQALRPKPAAPTGSPRLAAWLCIHAGEGAWNSNTGNGFYGGLQMDWSFMRSYGREFMGRWGTADRWPAWAQIAAADRAYLSGRGFSPWPNTARACGLL